MQITSLERGAVRSATGRGGVGSHELVFAEPRALWPGGPGLGASPALEGPVILRYRTDDFMERFMKEVAEASGAGWSPLSPADHLEELEGEEVPAGEQSGPGGLGGPSGQSAKETRWLAPGSAGASEAASPYKLFLPYHGDFHLVVCSFLCRHPGWPDHPPDGERGEAVRFLIRRRRIVDGPPPAGGSARTAQDAAVGTSNGGPDVPAGEEVEEAWVPGTGWVAAGTARSPRPVDGEERLPLVRVEGASGRRVYVGYLPLSSADTYEAGPDDPLSALGEARELVDERVVAKLGEIKAIGKTERWIWGRGVWELLDARLSAVRRHLFPRPGEVLPTYDSLTQQQRALVDHMQSAQATAPLGPSWKNLVAAARAATSAEVFPHDLVRIPTGSFDALESKVIEATPGAVGDVHGSSSAYAVARGALDAARRERLELSFQWSLDLLETLEGTVPETAEALRRTFDAAGGSPESPLSPDLPSPDEVGGQARLIVQGIWAAPTDRHRDEGRTSLTLAQSLWVLFRLREEVLDEAVAEAGSAGAPFDPGEVDFSDLRSAWEVDVATVPGSLPQVVRAGLSELGSGFHVPKFAPSAPEDGGLHYVARCIYEKTACRPAQVLLSDASASFGPAPIFDPDAPAREVRIPFPLDTSLAALKKAKRGVGIMLSNGLKAKMGRATPRRVLGMDIRMPSFGGGARAGLGVIWTLSIPIVTICAMILMLIVASILHVIFRWLPFLVVAYPIRLKGGSSS